MTYVYPYRGQQLCQFRRRLKDYGLTKEEYRDLAAEGCRICGTLENLVMDHCHKTNKFRGLLCAEHNLGLGKFQDSIPHLEAAIAYLRISSGC
jgi:hypothetical protein